MTDIRDLTDVDDVAFARRLIADPGVADRARLSRSTRGPSSAATRSASSFAKRLETLRAAAERLTRIRAVV